MSECFAIISLSSGKAVSVLSNQLSFKLQKSNLSDEVNLSHFREEDNQFWFWDGSTIRSKKYPNKVLDFHFYGWKQRGHGKVYLYDHHGKPNQRWKLVNGELILEYQKLRLTLEDGLKICCEIADAEKNQKWTLEVTSKRYVNCY